MEKELSSAFYEEMKKLEGRYPNRLALLLPALHAAQEETGWLPQSVIDEIAAFIEIHPARVREVASFYTMFNLDPVGKYQLNFCTNVACALRGSDELVHYCEKKLGIRCGETTKDGKVTLREEECLGSCGTAPVVMVNHHEYREQMDIAKLEKLLSELG